MISPEDIEYFKTNFNVDLTNKTEEEIDACLEDIENNLNKKIYEVNMIIEASKYNKKDLLENYQWNRK